MNYEFMGFDEATLKRFWSKVDTRGPDDCWEWIGSYSVWGYGAFWANRKNFRAHRLALTLQNPPFNTALLALHKCDNKACVNPNHLYWGTNSDNMQDSYKRSATHRINNRLHIAQLNASRAPVKGRRKLTPPQVDYIKLLLEAGLTHQHIASCYKVAKYTIFKIKHGLTLEYAG